jgi:hyperosmotically inducible periplasmic protein
VRTQSTTHRKKKHHGKEKQRRTDDSSQRPRGHNNRRQRANQEASGGSEDNEHLKNRRELFPVVLSVTVKESTKTKKTKMKSTYTLALIIATGTLFTSTAPSRAADMDDRIEASAKKSYVFKTYLADDSIKTVSKDGAVTLTGTVSETSHKSLAENTVESLPGVTSVDNQLKVQGGPAEHSDAWLGLKVKSTLLFHRNVRATKTDVNVADGNVILSGEASSMAQKELATEYASDVEGVKSVKNEMTIAKVPAKPAATLSEKIDDASITGQIKSSLMSRRSTSALKTKVTTVDGVVTVSGIAKNAAEKSLVTKLVTDVDGVTSVINNMTIAVPVAGK